MEYRYFGPSDSKSYEISQYIKQIRKRFSDNGGNPVDFPKYLEGMGCSMLGFLVKCSTKFLMAMELTR